MHGFVIWHLGAVLMCLSLVACSGGEEEVVEQPRPVRFQEVGFLGGQQTRTFAGSAQSDRIIDLSFRNAGVVEVLNLSIGKTVRRGELLGRLDNVQARLAYEQAVTALNSAASQMTTTKLNLDRIRLLYEKGSASLSDYENAKNGYETAQASFESAQRGVDIQSEQLNHGFLYAPESGIISIVDVELDENVVAGQRVGVLNAGQEMEIALGLPESVINKVTAGMSVNISFDAVPDQTFTGLVSEVSPAINTNTSTYPVRIVITNADSSIRSGMTANVTFDFSAEVETGTSLVVPHSAVSEDGQGRFVYVIQSDGAASSVQKTYVVVGAMSSEGFEILEGLTFGQRVVTAGLQTLLDGQMVSI